MFNRDSDITVLESPGIPVTGSSSILKGYHNPLIDGSPSITVSPYGINYGGKMSPFPIFLVRLTEIRVVNIQIYHLEFLKK